MKYVALCKNGDAIFGDVVERNGLIVTMKDATRAKSYLGADTIADIAMGYIEGSDEQIVAFRLERIVIRNWQMLIPLTEKARKNIERYIAKE